MESTKNKNQDRNKSELMSFVRLQFDDAIYIAKGCFDYSGGHRDRELEIYHHGIQTVINSLEGAKNSNLSDLQSKMLHKKGKAT